MLKSQLQKKDTVLSTVHSHQLLAWISKLEGREDSCPFLLSPILSVLTVYIRQ